MHTGTKPCSAALVASGSAVTPNTHHQSRREVTNSGQAGPTPVLSEAPSNMGIVQPFAVTGLTLHSNEYEQAINDSCTDSDDNEEVRRLRALD